MYKKIYLFDTKVISCTHNTHIVPGKVQKNLEIFFEEEFFSDPPKRWEVRYDNGYPNVFYDKYAEIYRCYYTSFITDKESQEYSLEERKNISYQPAPGRVAGLLYAESVDGLHWIKPSLGRVGFEGSKENNIIFSHAHGAGVFLDEHESDSRKRYKLVMKDEVSNEMVVAFSSDGTNFGELIKWPEFNPVADTHNFAFWDNIMQKYVLITRTWDGVRLSAACTSDDFLRWSEPTEIYRGIDLNDQIYSMPVFVRHGLYFGVGSIFHGGDQSKKNYDDVDCELLYSHDCLHWNRVCAGEAFISRGKGVYGSGEQDCGCIYASTPIQEKENLIFYYMGGNGQHTNYRETALMRCTINADMLAGVKSSDDSGFLRTRRFIPLSTALTLTAEIAQGGSISLMICQNPRTMFHTAQPLPGLGYEDFQLIQTSEYQYEISCKTNAFRTLTAQCPKEGVCLQLKLNNATVYTLDADIEGVEKKLSDASRK